MITKYFAKSGFSIQRSVLSQCICSILLVRRVPRVHFSNFYGISPSVSLKQKSYVLCFDVIKTQKIYCNVGPGGLAVGDLTGRCKGQWERKCPTSNRVSRGMLTLMVSLKFSFQKWVGIFIPEKLRCLQREDWIYQCKEPYEKALHLHSFLNESQIIDLLENLTDKIINSRFKR